MSQTAYRTHHATEVTEALVGQKVTLSGWVDRRRDHGGVAFIDLRDNTGLVQVVIYDEDMARPLRSEFVIQVVGEVRLRPDGNENDHLATGKIEVVAETIEILAKSDALPFQVSTALENESENKLPGEDVRLKYRYLDLRRPSMQHNLKLRSDMAKAARHALEEMDFTEVETPTFIKSTPEGARDFVVPARLVPGSWYALPQSPQLLKQLLMVSGVERYYQLARCYRDEDFRADRQPEFTQLDMEMAFVDQEDVMAMAEKVIAANGNAGDQLMALGLGDKIIATAYTNSDINPKWDAEYKAIPEAAETYISLETVLSLEPDFVYGRSSSFTEKYNTEHDTLTKYGIMSLSSIEGYTVGADVDVVYQDFYNLGRIFQVEDKAEEIVSGMKGKITAAEEAVAGQEATPVFVFDMAQEEGAYTCGNNFTSKLIEHAGGVNIFNDLDTTWATVSWETVVERAPEVIIIDDYGDTSLEEKIAQLKENPALATVPAIQNDRIISVTLCESFASSMTGDTVEKFARAFHPDCFA